MGHMNGSWISSLGIQSIKGGGGGVDLLILLYCLFFPYFLKILHENGIILSQRRVQANPLDPPLGHGLNPYCLMLRLCFVNKYNITI